MKYTKLNLVFFSATATTKKIVSSVAKGVAAESIIEYDITQGQKSDIVLGPDELIVVGMPVYAGRIPAIAAEALSKFSGNNTPAIIVCVYGNRDFDDALLEMQDIVRANSFKVISAASFIAQHSIFPTTGAGRPDSKDIKDAIEFGQRSMERLFGVKELSALLEIVVRGNYPYKVPGAIPLRPKANKKCDECLTCVKMCPTEAIEASSPRKTIKSRCISCARCIYVCPQDARHFGGLLYGIVSKKFTKANLARKEPYMVLE